MLKIKILLLAALVVILLSGSMLGRSADADESYTLESVVVVNGDTLWGIANENCPDNMDRRKYIRYIETDNDCTANIRPGDVIVVRCYEK